MVRPTHGASHAWCAPRVRVIQDTLKTTLQVAGPAGYEQLRTKVGAEGPTVLYQGALANALASFVGSYPWFFSFNLAMRYLPAAPTGALLPRLVRSAAAVRRAATDAHAGAHA